MAKSLSMDHYTEEALRGNSDYQGHQSVLCFWGGRLCLPVILTAREGTTHIVPETAGHAYQGYPCPSSNIRLLFEILDNMSCPDLLFVQAPRATPIFRNTHPLSSSAAKYVRDNTGGGRLRSSVLFLSALASNDGYLPPNSSLAVLPKVLIAAQLQSSIPLSAARGSILGVPAQFSTAHFLQRVLGYSTSRRALPP